MMEPFDTHTPQDILAASAFKIEQDIGSLRSTVANSLVVGDTMFGKMGHIDLTKDVKSRNSELHTKKETLLHEIDKKEAIINRSNRDFSDVSDTIETQPKKKLNFIEDYTLAILSMAYVFMIVTAIYFYVSTTTNTIGVALLQSILGSALITLIACMLLYSLS